MKQLLRSICLAGIMLCLTLSVNAEHFNIKGIVKDAKTGKTLTGASIRVHGTTLGCASNSKGEFKLKDIPEGEYIIKASFSGYKAERVNINLNGNKNSLILSLVPSPINLDEVTITGTGTHHKLKNTPVQTEVITKKTIENIGSTSIEDLLATVSPSFDFSPNIMGSYMSINGLGNKYILVLVDGVRLTGDVSGNIDLTRINVGNIEKIEIVKGASSSLYGSEAIGGVINIITKKSSKKLNVSTSSQLGENSAFSENAGIDFKIGKLNSSTTFDYRKSDSWDLTDENDPGSLYHINKFYTKTVTQKFTYSPSKSIKTYLGGSFYNKKIFNQRIEKKYYDYLYNDYSFNAGIKYIINQKNSINLDVNSDIYNYDYLYFTDYKDYKRGDKVINKRQHCYTANLKGIFKLSKKHTLIAGAEYFSDKMETSEDKIPSKEKDAYTQSLYIQDEYKILDKLTLVAGLRYVNHETFGDHLTPKVSLLQKIGNFNLRASYSHGFKTPSLQEIYYKYYFSRSKSWYLGNPDLKPEKSKYYTVSAEYVKDWFNASVSVYRNNIDNMIERKIITEASQLPEIYQGETELFDKAVSLYSNIDQARSQGIDFIFNAHIGNGFTLGGGYSYVDAKDLSNGKEVRLDRIARNYANIRLGWDKNWSNYGLNVTLTGKYQDGKFYEVKETKEYNLWRLSTSHKFLSNKKFNLNLLAGIDNIFDYTDTTPVHYSTSSKFYGTLTPGRTFFVGIKINFSK